MKLKEYRRFVGIVISLSVLIVVLYFVASPIIISPDSAFEILSSISQISITLFAILTAFVFVFFQMALPRWKRLPEEELWIRFKRLTPELFLSISFVSLAFYCWLIMAFVKPDYNFSLFPISIAFVWMAFNLFWMIVIVHFAFVVMYPSEKEEQQEG